MDGFEILLMALASAVTLFVAGGRYMLARLKRLETENETRRAAALQQAEYKATLISAENQKLLHRVGLLEVKAALVDELSRQLAELRLDLSDLRARLEKTEAELTKVTEQKTGLEQQLEQAGAEIKRLEMKLHESERREHDLEVMRATYDKVLALIGIERSEKPEPGEGKAPEPEASEVKSEEKTS